MKEEILLIGSTQIAHILLGYLNENNYLASLNSPRPAVPSYVVDLFNFEKESQDLDLLNHNATDLKPLLDYSASNSVPFIFVYKNENIQDPASVTNMAINLIKQYAIHTNCTYVLVECGDIYSPKINTSGILEQFILEISSGSPLNITNDNHPVNLIHLQDFLLGFEEILRETSSFSHGEIYSLSADEPVTELELAHFLNDLTDLKLQILYSTDETATLPNPISNGNKPMSWRPKITLETGIKELFKHHDIPVPEDSNDEIANERTRLNAEFKKEKEEERERLRQEEELRWKALEAADEKRINKLDPHTFALEETLPKKTPHKKKIMSLVAALIVIDMLPSAIFGFNLAKGIHYLRAAGEEINNLSFSKSNQYSRLSEEHFGKLGQDIPFPVILSFRVLGLKENDAYSAVSTSRNLANIIAQATSLDFSKIDSNSNVLGASTQNALELIELTELKLTQSETENKFLINSLLKTYEQILNKKEILEKINSLQAILPEILGYNGAQKYVVIYEDPDEIRPSGGILTNYSIIDIQYGKIHLQESGEIKDIDEQIQLNQINIPAPLPLARSVEEYNQLLLKDAGWEPDFAKSAQNIAKLFERSTGQSIHGVIAVNSTFSKNIANEPVQKLFEGLERKDILIYHKDGSVLSKLIKNNWAGTLMEIPHDYLYIVDSSIGGNTANRFVNKKIAWEGNYKDGSYIRIIRITYNNAGSKDYLNHLRVLVPQNAFLNSTILETESQKSNITRKVVVDPYEDKAIYATTILIEGQETVTVEFEYESKLVLDQGQNLQLLVQKQPGQNNPIELRFAGPGGETFFTGELHTDQIFEFPL